MINKLNPLPLIPFVDGAPTEDTNQSRIKWIHNGDTLNGAETKLSNEGVLNQSGVQIQKNVVQLNDDGIIHNDKINEVIDVVNQVVENLGAVGDTHVIDTLNKAVDDIVVLKLDTETNKTNIATNTLSISGVNGEIGVYDPLTDPKHRTIRKDIIFVKGELGKYAGFDENGDVDPTSTGSGLKYKVMQNALGVSIHEGRITKLEDDWALSDVGQLTTEVVDIRNELGPKNLATFQSVYVRLVGLQNVQSILSTSVDNISSYIGMTANPSVKIGDTVDGLVISNTELRDTVYNPSTGLVFRVTSIEQDIGSSSTSGTVKGEIASVKRHLIDIDDLLGEDSTEGLRGEVMEIQTSIGTDSTPNTVKGRVLNLENMTRDMSNNVNDLTATVGNTSTGLVAANIALGKSVYGDGTSSDPFIKDGISKTAKDNKTAIGVSTVGTETGLYKLIADLAGRITVLEGGSNLATRVDALEINKADKTQLDDYYTKDESDERFASKIPTLVVEQDLPATESVYIGDPLNLTIGVSGGVAPFTYVWKRGSTVLSEDTSNLAIDAMTSGDAGVYTVTVKDAGISEIQSVECTVTAIALPFVSTDLPAVKTLTTGDSWVMEPEFDGGVKPYSHYWTKNGTHVSVNSQTASIPFNDVTPADSAVWKDMMTDVNGKSIATTACSVEVYDPLAFNIDVTEGDVTVPAGSPFNLVVQAKGGKTPYSFNWMKNGLSVASGGDSTAFTIAQVASGDAGVYNVVVKDALNQSITSKSATLIVS